MAQRKQKRAGPSSRSPQLAAVNLHAAGTDIGCGRITDPRSHPVMIPSRYALRAYTADLEALADWLATSGIAAVALESTGSIGSLFESGGSRLRSALKSTHSR